MSFTHSHWDVYRSGNVKLVCKQMHLGGALEDPSNVTLQALQGTKDMLH